MRLPIVVVLAIAVLLIPAVSAGHGFYIIDHAAQPGPRDIGGIRWETDGDTTRIDLEGGGRGTELGVIVLVGKEGVPLQGHVRATANDTEIHASAQGVDADVEWETALAPITVHWRPALEPKTCVLVVAWAGDVEDVAPGSAAGSLDDADALWDEGQACSHRKPLSYAASCGHPDIPAYCSPGSGWLAVSVLLVLSVAVSRRI